VAVTPPRLWAVGSVGGAELPRREEAEARAEGASCAGS
jgi:hypothetical protein